MTAPLRLGVIGCGRVFERFHLPAIERAAGVVLAAACDSDPARLRWLTQRVPGLIPCETAEALTAQRNLDAVLVLTPPVGHEAPTLAALNAGMPVLVEKPMALSLDQGRRMVEAARRGNRRLQVGFNRRFREPYRRMRQWLSQHGKTVVGGRFELSFPTSSWHARTDFLGNDQLGGGAFDDVLSHQIDLIAWLVGWPDVVRATPGVGDSLQAELRIGSSSFVCLAGHGSYREHLQLQLASGELLEATGSSTRRAAGASRWWLRVAALRDRASLVVHRIRGTQSTTAQSFDRQLHDFLSHLEKGRSEGATGEEGLQAIRVVTACRVSARGAGGWCSLKQA
jgi:predicted dehydrogenase